MKRPRFTIRSLVIATTCFDSLLFGGLWLTKDLRERRREELKLRSFGAVYAYVDINWQANVVFKLPIATGLGKLKSIEKVELQGFAVDRETLENLSELERIDSLLIKSCSFLDVQDLSLLDGISKLRWLHFRNTTVTDVEVEALSRLHNLEGISFYNSQITSTGLSRLHEATPNLRISVRP